MTAGRVVGTLRSDALRDRLLRHIRSLPAGERIPSERALARQSGLSLLTVNKVVSNLVTEGLLERTRGVGTFVARRVERPSGAAPGAQLRVIRYVVRDTGAALTESMGYIASFFRGISRRARAEGYEILPTPFDSVDGTERLPEDLFESLAVEGAIFVEVGVPDYRPLWRFLEDGRRIVGFDYAAPDRGLSSVCFDNAGALREVVRALVAEGHRRMAYVGPTGYVGQPQDERIAGFREGLLEAGLDAAAAPVVLASAERVEGHLKELLGRRSRPTAFALFNDWDFLPLERACAAHGLSIPRDVSAVGFGETFARQREPIRRIDSVAFDEEDMGRAGFELCSSGARGVVRRFPGRLVRRGTTAPPGRKASS